MVVLVFILSSQSYEMQTIQPFLKQRIDSHTLQEALPDITIPYRNTQFAAKADPYRFVEFILRKGAHLFLYACLAASAYLALRTYRLSYRWKLLMILAIVLCIASLDEWNQSFRNRTSSIHDVWIDFVGGLLGLGFITAIRIFRKRNEAIGRTYK